IPTIKIKSGGSRGNKNEAACFVDTQAAPAVRSAGGLPGVGRPRVIPEFSRVGDRVKDPAPFAGSRIICADVPGRGRPRPFLVSCRNDEEVLINASGRGRNDCFAVRQIAVDVFLEVNRTVLAEGFDNLSSLGVQTQDPILHWREDSLTISI